MIDLSIFLTLSILLISIVVNELIEWMIIHFINIPLKTHKGYTY